MSELNERFNVMMSAEDRRHLRALALSNTGGNDSEMIRLLVRLAAQNPDGLDLNRPIYIEGKAETLARVAA